MLIGIIIIFNLISYLSYYLIHYLIYIHIYYIYPNHTH